MYGAKPSTCFSWRSGSRDRSRSPEPPLNTRSFIRRIALIAPIVAVLALTGAVSAGADSSQPVGYSTAVKDAYALVQGASPNDTATAGEAVMVLQAGTDGTQPEILADLVSRPPDFADASARLKALLTALDHPASTADPELARQQLGQVLSMHRYDALHRPPNLVDRLGQWVRDRISQLLKLLLGGTGGPSVPAVFFYAVGAVVLGAIAFLLFRSTRGRFAEGAVSQAASGPRAPADYFADADRLAAAGDRVGSIRALCAGVAATLAGERTWEGSPLTVREIFQRSADPTRLRPLLLPFEAAIYGGREIDAETYELARQVAAPFRARVQQVAA